MKVSWLLFNANISVKAGVISRQNYKLYNNIIFTSHCLKTYQRSEELKNWEIKDFPLLLFTFHVSLFLTIFSY